MVAVTYGATRAAAPVAAETTPSKKRRSIFTIVFHAIAESQMRRAERELVRHRHLLPHDFEVRCEKPLPRSRDQVPRGGW